MINYYIIGILLAFWIQCSKNNYKNNKYINFFNKIKLPLLICSILLFFYQDIKKKICNSPINNIYTEHANF